MPGRILLCLLLVSGRGFAAPTHLVTEPPVSISEVESGTYLVDFGKVAFGNLVLTGAQDTRARVTVHFGESLEDGRVDRTPPGNVRYRDTRATLVGDTPKRIAPGRNEKNTRPGDASTPPAIRTPREWDVVIPFRWVEIEGFPGTLQAANVSRNAAYLSAWNDAASDFRSSSDLLNRIWSLSRDSIKATTFAGLYVDGDRERIPYEGDAYLNQISHYYTDYDKQMARDTFDHLLRHPTWPTEWASHMVFMAHADWMHNADSEWIRQRYDLLKTKLLLPRSRPDGLIESDDDQIRKGDLVDWPPGERDGYVFSSVNTVVNAFHLRTLALMSELATAIGNVDDARYYTDIYDRTYASFQAELFSTERRLYRDGLATDHSALHANLFPLAFGLVPEDRKDAVTAWLAEQDMRCSVYAAQYLLQALLQNGEATRALELVTAQGNRSWRHMVESDATITWEAWDAQYKPNLDWNHAWGAAPANLLPRYVLGVEPLEPGWSAARIRPTPANLEFASGTVPTPGGAVAVHWQMTPAFQLDLELPTTMEGQLQVPVTPGSSEVTINGKPARARKDGNYWIVEDRVTGSVEVVVR